MFEGSPEIKRICTEFLIELISHCSFECKAAIDNHMKIAENVAGHLTNIKVDPADYRLKLRLIRTFVLKKDSDLNATDAIEASDIEPQFLDVLKRIY